jgi:hypothetical protein
MHRLALAGMRPGRSLSVAGGPHGVEVWAGEGEHVVFDRRVAQHVFVRVA